MPKPPSAYVPLDVNYLRDRDIRRAGPDAELLYIRGLSYCKGSFSDGFIPEYDLVLIAVDLKSVQKRIEKLLETGLWQRVEDGWQIRSWSIWNETSDETASKRKRAAERQARKRERESTESHESHDVSHPDSHAPVTRDGAVTDETRHSTKEEEEEEELASRRDAERDVTPLRPRDEIFDAIVEVCGIDAKQLTPAGRGPINKAVKELREVGATAGQITLRARNYRQQYRDANLTPIALAKHWASLGNGRPSSRPSTPWAGA